MRVYELIRAKRDGEELPEQEIRRLALEYAAGNVPDYQMAAFLMAVYFQGMTEKEVLALTLACAESGDQIDLSSLPFTTVDKHSTGGVGDKATLVLTPLVRACGLPVGKMSGRSLGHTGGTLDKLESIPGFKTELSIDTFLQRLKTEGMVLAGQTGNLTPADKALYDLRDLTATVESIPLVAASVMSKKLAAGSDAFVLDVKVGRAAFAKTMEEGRSLARTMVTIAKGAGRRAVAWLTAMDQPLGHAVGNALEVKESIDALKGEGPADLHQLCLTLAGEMLFLGGVAPNPEEGQGMAEKAIQSGAALDQFRRWVEVQGGDPSVVDRPELLPHSSLTAEVNAASTGWITSIDGLEVGLTTMMLGAGRDKKGESIHPGVGIVFSKKVGSNVTAGERLAVVYGEDERSLETAVSRISKAIVLSQEPVDPPTLLFERFD